MRTCYPEPDPIVPLTYSIAGAAKAWCVGRTTAYKIVDAGAVRTIKIGPVTRIPKEEVERIAREGTDAQAVAA